MLIHSCSQQSCATLSSRQWSQARGALSSAYASRRTLFNPSRSHDAVARPQGPQRPHLRARPARPHGVGRRAAQRPDESRRTRSARSSTSGATACPFRAIWLETSKGRASQPRARRARNLCCGETGCELARVRQPAFVRKERVATRRAPLLSLAPCGRPRLRAACAAAYLHVWAASALSSLCRLTECESSDRETPFKRRETLR